MTSTSPPNTVKVLVKIKGYETYGTVFFPYLPGKGDHVVLDVGVYKVKRVFHMAHDIPTLHLRKVGK
jgi:hypothetical protein